MVMFFFFLQRLPTYQKITLMRIFHWLLNFLHLNYWHILNLKYWILFLIITHTKITHVLLYKFSWNKCKYIKKHCFIASDFTNSFRNRQICNIPKLSNILNNYLLLSWNRSKTGLVLYEKWRKILWNKCI